MTRYEGLMNSKLRFASGVSVLFTTLAFGHIMIEDTRHMMSHGESHQGDSIIAGAARNRAGSGPVPGCRLLDGTRRQYSRFIGSYNISYGAGL